VGPSLPDSAVAVADISGEQLAAISREMVRIKADHYGKGPTEAKTYVCDNIILAVLKGGLTRVEETLVAAGDTALIREVRLRFQDQMKDSFTGAVERILDRKVIGYGSQIVLNPTYIFELFVLDAMGRNSQE
jgi:uncharacterized protein YbcI